MKLNSDDILKQNFSTRAFGFNKEEVMAFLELVATEYEELFNENMLLKKQVTERDNQFRLMNETRGQVNEILNTLQQFKSQSLEADGRKDLIEKQLTKKDEIIESINSEVGAKVGEILATIQGFKEIMEARPKEPEFMNKDDLEKFVSTVQRVKEEEIKKAEEEAALILNEAREKAERMVEEAEREEQSIRENMEFKSELIVNEAQQKAERIISEAERIKEEASLIINEAQGNAEQMVREAEDRVERVKEQAALIIREAQEKAEKMVRETEDEIGRKKEAAELIIQEARHKAEGMIKEAEGEAERRREESLLIVRKAQQKAEAIIREAESEESRIKTAVAELKKQHQFFKERIKEVVELHLQILGSVSEGGEN